MSAAALVAPPPAPPHDPLWMTLGGCAEWRLQADSELEVGKHDNSLALAPLPGTFPVLGEPSGSLGGLVPPSHVAIDGQNVLWLLDKVRSRLRRFDPCACRFKDVPCAQLELGDPRAIEADGDRLYIADAAAPGRVLVIDARHLALRALLRPPKSNNPWQPVAVAARRGRIAVADAANGRIDLFAGWGGWIKAWEGTGAPARLVFDRCGKLYAATAGDDAVILRDAGGKVVATATDPNEVRCDFPPTPFPVDQEGRIDLSGWCRGAGWFDTAGNPVPAPANAGPAYPQTASAITVALDSRIARCRWHRVVVDASLPENGGVRLAIVTAEVELLPSVIVSLPDSAWSILPLGAGGTGEALILAPSGRYAWLRITLFGDGSAGPLLRAIDVEYPRISLRRYLPAAFGADASSADFADRMLAIFDRGLRDIETRIDEQATWFDPRSAPSEAGGSGPDFLSWLASWVGITFDRRWPEARRRSLLRLAGRLFACRGTVNGLRGSLLLWLGWDRLELIVPVRPRCAPQCVSVKPLPPLPPLILEHWKLRRWLYVGAGRLGDAAVLWGSHLLGRSVLGETARADATRLDAVRDPLRDPFHESAHKISLFLPACALATPAARGAALRLVAENKPAHVLANIVPVHPRMRIGVQASIGFDAVVGCWPRGVALDEALLGRGTVLAGAVPGGVEAPRLGRDSRLKSPRSTPFFASTGEAVP
jgi:phage tail-like protein